MTSLDHSIQVNKTAWITGAGSGLGRALSLDLATQGYLVVLIDIAADTLQKVAEECLALGAQVRAVLLDISRETDVHHVVDALIADLGRVDMLINCAGFSITSECINIDHSSWNRIIGVNLLGTILMSTLALRQMKVQGSGQIVNIASMFGLVPASSGIAYSTTKHAVVGFTRTLAIEAKDFGVSVHLVCPGFIQTKFFENAEYLGVEKSVMLGQMPRSMMSVEDAAQRILRGVAKRKRTLVFPFYVRVLWWLDKWFPWLSEQIWLSEIRKYRKI